MEVKAIYQPNSKAYQRHRKIVALRNRLENDYLSLGAELYRFKQNRDYEKLGHPSFASYLADPDVDLSERNAYRMIGAYGKFVLELEIEKPALIEVGISKLETIRPFVTDENSSELVTMASVLSRSDLKEEMQEKFGDNGNKPNVSLQLRNLKKRLWSVQEYATEEQKRLLAKAYELVDRALSSATVAEHEGQINFHREVKN